MSTQEQNYPASVFTVLGRVVPELRLAQIRSVSTTYDGRRVILRVTPVGERVATKRALGILKVPAGCHALDLYDQRSSRGVVCEILVGTETVNENPALEQLLSGIGTILEREGRTNLVCAATSDTHCYARIKRDGVPTPWVDLTAEFDAIEIAYVPGARVYIARKPDSNRIGVLPIQAALAGDFSAHNWNFVSVPGARLVTGIQPRIHTSRAAMFHIVTDDGLSATVAYDLEMIGVGQIEAEADTLSRTSSAVRFRGLVDGNCAMAQNDAMIESSGLPPGVSLVSTDALSAIFGNAARSMVAACITA